MDRRVWNFAIVAFVLLSSASDSKQQVATTDSKASAAPTWNVTFTPNNLTVHMGLAHMVSLSITTAVDSRALNDYRFLVRSEDPQLAFVDKQISAQDIDPNTGQWWGNVSIEALFLGSTRIYVERVHTKTNASERSSNMLTLTIVRPERVIDHIFTGSVILLVSLLYINFGAALDVTVLRGLLAQPVGPMIGFVTQFVFMPLLSYGLGSLIFPDSPELQLGLFFTGVSPSGGASNIWAALLGGNLNLSVLMTTISNFAAFGMMPLWLFTLGQMIFDRVRMEVPYVKIATYAVGLVVPLAIGLGVQRCSPRTTRLLVRLLKPISTALLAFIIVFAIVTNLYLFQLFSWQIAVAGLALPWLGYVFAWIVAKLLGQSVVDSLTIGIETGVQNTGIAIFMLRLSLPQPQADLTTVIPVAVAIMTPWPLLGLYIYKRCIAQSVKYGITEYIDEHHIT